MALVSAPDGSAQRLEQFQRSTHGSVPRTKKARVPVGHPGGFLIGKGAGEEAVPMEEKVCQGLAVCFDDLGVGAEGDITEDVILTQALESYAVRMSIFELHIPGRRLALFILLGMLLTDIMT